MSDTPTINTPGGLQDGPKSEGTLNSQERRRVLLKLSGEVIGGGKIGIDPITVRNIATQIGQAAQEVEIAIVVGGGNFFRGAELSENGMDRRRADYMGMLGTVMNALALQDFLLQSGVDTRVQSAINMSQVAEPYIPQRAIRHLQKDRVVIFGAGTGLPYFSTDTVAAQRALEIGADEVLMAKSGVDGVYTADPKTNPDAQRFENLTYDEAIVNNIRVMDLTAMTMCKDNSLPMMVFGMEGEGNVTNALLGQRIGTTVSP